MIGTARRLGRSNSGAVAPIVALSLFGLIAVGGIAFDFSRLATMDTELQDAADQAALAGASQLDGQPQAVTRAVAAAQSLLINRSYMANDGCVTAIQTGTSGTSCAVTSGSSNRILFYSTKADAEAGSNGLAPGAATDAAAKFIKVAVVARRANYAMTPIAGALSSGDMNAEAVAGLSSAICKVPPVMICNPQETSTNLTFDAEAYTGDGVALITGDANGPGNFGFLESNVPGANPLKKALGYNAVPGDCSPTVTVTTKPGMGPPLMDAFNTRFDIDANGSSTCPKGGTCSPSQNSRKDLVKTGIPNQNCNGWKQSPNPYLPPLGSTAPLTSGYPDIMGHPRDICHAAATSIKGAYALGCTAGEGRIGNGIWDRDAYFRVNYGWNTQAIWTSQTGLSASATRYQVYQWELAHPATTGVAAIQSTAGGSGYSYPVCLAPGITPSPTVVDRRRISVAVINCSSEALAGHTADMKVLKYVDIFLVEPSYPRIRTYATSAAADVYVEIIGTTKTGAGSTAAQVVRHDTPYLVK